MMTLDQRKRGREIRIVGGIARTRSDVGSKRRSSDSVATHLMRNIKVSLP
jgi:hypothetical protein